MRTALQIVLLIICAIGAYRFALKINDQSKKGNFPPAFISLLALFVCVVLGFWALSHLMK